MYNFNVHCICLFHLSEVFKWCSIIEPMGVDGKQAFQDCFFVQNQMHMMRIWCVWPWNFISFITNSIWVHHEFRNLETLKINLVNSRGQLEFSQEMQQSLWQFPDFWFSCFGKYDIVWFSPWLVILFFNFLLTREIITSKDDPGWIYFMCKMRMI